MFSISTVFRGMKFEVCRSGRDRSVSAETGDPTGRITRSLRYNQRFGSKIATSIQTHTVLRASNCRPYSFLLFLRQALEGSSVWMASQSMAGSSCWTAWDTRWSRPRMPLGCRRTCETTCLLETWHAHLHATQVGQLLELVAQGPHALRLALEAPEQSFKRFLLGLGLQDCEAAIEQQPNVAEAYLLASRRCAYHFDEPETALNRCSGRSRGASSYKVT